MAAFIDAQGATQQFEMSLDVVREAALGVCPSGTTSTPPCRPTWKPTATPSRNSARVKVSSSVPVKKHGIRPPTLALSWMAAPSLKPGPSFVSPTTKARVLLMPAIGALIEDKLLSDLEMNAAVSTP
jgi:hypothetical protein